MDSEKIGKFIAELRKENKMTQEELGKKILVDRGTISKWERGIYVPNPEILLSLSKILSVSVNEILLGEKETSKNKVELNNVTVQILDKNRKLKKYFIGITILLLVLLMVFFLYYFITSYNSISIYKITGESDNFVISDGLFIISPEKSYLELGNVDNINSIEIKEIRLFYKKNNKEYTISKNDKNINLLKNTFQYDELFSYNDIKYVKSNLYLEFILNNDKKKEVVKLTLTKDFSNNIIFRKKIDNISDSNEYLDLDEKIPEYIKQNYKLDDKDRKYYFNEKINNIEINYSYFYDSNVYIVEELYDNYIKQYTYYANSKDISYVCFYDNNEIAEFSYNLSNERCISGDCNSTLVDFFVENYLSKIKFY